MNTLNPPGAIVRPVCNRSAGMTAQLGLILHVPVGYGSLFNEFNNPANPKSSTWWVSKAGGIEQYLENPALEHAWAQAAGNRYYHSVEVEGMPDEPMTDAQIDAVGLIHAWGHLTLGWAVQLANAVGERGLGVHFMGGAAWGGHTCPDPSPGGQGPRSHQRPDVIAAALHHLGTPAGVPFTPPPAGTTLPPAQPIPGDNMARIATVFGSDPKSTKDDGLALYENGIHPILTTDELDACQRYISVLTNPTDQGLNRTEQDRVNTVKARTQWPAPKPAAAS